MDMVYTTDNNKGIILSVVILVIMDMVYTASGSFYDGLML